MNKRLVSNNTYSSNSNLQMPTVCQNLKNDTHQTLFKTSEIFHKNNSQIEIIDVFSKINLLHTNIQSIASPIKIEELNLFLEQLKSEPSAILLSEHWITDENLFLLHKIKNFTLGSYFLRKDKRGGGVCILVNSSLSLKTNANFENFSIPLIMECCAIEIKSLQCIIICIYRPPPKCKQQLDRFFDQFDSMLNFIYKKYPNTIIFIGGDFNINLLDNKSEKYEFINILESYNLHYYFDIPTRTNQNNYSSCIDNILSNLHPSFLNFSHVIDTGLSDHTAQYVSLSYSIKAKTKSKEHNYCIRNFSARNISLFQNYLYSINWGFLYDLNSFENINNAYQKFQSLFQYYFDLSFPFIHNKTHCSTKKGWITKGIKIASVNKRKLHTQMKSSRDENFIAYVKRYKKTFKQCITKAKQMYFSNKIKLSTNKVKSSWNIIKSETKIPNDNTEQEIEVECNGALVKNPEKIANIFNEHYINVCRNLGVKTNTMKANDFLSNTHTKIEGVFLDNIDPVSSLDVLLLIKQLKPSKACGYDNIPTFIIKKCASQICKPIALLINLSFKLGQFPDSLKHTIIKPIYKKNSKTNVENYRPIALLPSFSKIFEKVMYNKLMLYFENNNLLYCNQFGFRKNKNINDAIYQLISKSTNSIEN